MPLLRSSHFSLVLSISMGRIPVSFRTFRIRLYFFPASDTKAVISSVVGMYGGWLERLIIG